jgi:hypothetical protein
VCYVAEVKDLIAATKDAAGAAGAAQEGALSARQNETVAPSHDLVVRQRCSFASAEKELDRGADPLALLPDR